MMKHNLPGEGENCEWFERLNPFEQQETLRQARFKRRHWPELPDGPSSKFPDLHYPHILPLRHLEKALYPPIASAVLEYCECNRVAVHSEALNLRSSQLCCFNVMFPLRRDLSLAAHALAPCLPGVREVTAIEFEYTGPEGATEWLGEPPGGQRGRNRTSIDAAAWWSDGAGKFLTLIEWKYTERAYGTCGGFRSKGNRDTGRCLGLDITRRDAPGQCYLTATRPPRRYWEHMRQSGVDLAALSASKSCPFIGPFYQILRQHLLAAFLRKSEPVDEVFVLSVGFKGNASLDEMPPEQRAFGPKVIDAWNKCLVDVPPLRHANVEDVAAPTRHAPQAPDPQWLSYLSERYGL